MEKLVLIDGHSILNRAFYGVPMLNNSQGIPTNAVYGFLNIMFRILDEEKADYLAVAFDLSAPTFRHQKYSEYKGTRKPMPEELRSQVPLIKEVLGAMDIPLLFLEGYEADDIIGTTAKRAQAAGLQVTVVSGDRDLLQLSDEHILIRIPKTSKGQTAVYDYTPEEVRKEYGVTPLEFIDVKALMGDASDNIPGVPSIGEKTATQIIAQYHSIENAYEHVSELKPPRASRALAEHYEDAVFSKWLATICLEAPVPFELESMRINDLYTETAYEQMKRLEFRSILKRFDENVKTSAGAVTETEIIVMTAEEAEKELLPSLLRAARIGLQLKGDKLSLANEENKGYSITGSEETLNAITQKLFETVPEVDVIELKSMLHRIGCEERSNIRDLGVAAYLLNPLKDSYHADDLTRDYLDRLIPSEKEDAEKAAQLAGAAAFSTAPVILGQLKETGMEQLYLETELPLVYALAAMETFGVKVEGDRLSAFAEELKEGIAKIEKEIYEETGEVFNINSPKQLGVILFEKLLLPYGKKTKSGYSTSADILDKLAPDYPVVRKVLDYRMLTKLNSTYATGLAAYISEDGRIHGTFNQTITATGRISSTEPNLQNIPIRTEMGSRIRGVFVPSDGNVFVDADYSQIELRVLASMSEDEGLISAYKNAVDIHRVTASQVFHVPLEEVTPELRRNAKAVNFGVVYGISAFGLSEDLSISRAEAKEYINNYFATYPKVRLFLNEKITEAKEQGYISTLFGRRRPIPELKSSNFMQRSFGERIAMNSPIQGTAADIMKIAMVRVHRALKEKGLMARIALQIHDELLVECPENEAETVKELLREEMRNAADLSVALEVDAHTGHSWLEAH